MADKTAAKVVEFTAAQMKAQDAAVAKAVGVDLPAFVDKMRRGREPNAPEVRGAIFALGLIADRNTQEMEARLRWLERGWFWRLLHRKQRPPKT